MVFRCGFCHGHRINMSDDNIFVHIYVAVKVLNVHCWFGIVFVVE